MKARLLCCLLIVSIMSGCSKQKSREIEGAWQLVYAKTVAGGKLQSTFPGNVIGGQMKMWYNGHVIFSGLFKQDTVSSDNYGGGTYTLKGKMYHESIVYHASKNYVGQNIRMLLEISNDTLTQVWPVSENGRIDTTGYNVEKYIRL